MAMGMMQFVVAVEPSERAALDEAVEAGRRAEAQWLAKAREDVGLKYLRGTAAREARAGIRIEQAKLRSTGTLAGTRELVLAREVRAVLKARKMTRAYDPLPPAEAGAPGRPAGTRGPGLHSKTLLTDRVHVKLPSALGDQLVRACYWESAPAVAALREWQALWGDGVEVRIAQARRDGAPGVLAFFAGLSARRPTADALLRKRQLQQAVVTTGDIIRAAISRAAR